MIAVKARKGGKPHGHESIMGLMRGDLMCF